MFVFDIVLFKQVITGLKVRDKLHLHNNPIICVGLFGYSFYMLGLLVIYLLIRLVYHLDNG